ncbi:MAG: WHG domain-containing protein [Bacillota bacterium]|nr:WHG domain-containing protein [Bacillota bacterium]
MNEIKIIETAIEIINQDGLENLTLKKVATKLKIKSPSLYNHISSLEDLKNKISLYGWKQLEEKMILSIVGESGYEAIKCMAHAFYDYATENKGIFEAMLWYNKYMGEDENLATQNTFDVLFKILRKQNLSNETINHFIRTLRGFLEGYILLVNHQAFGYPLSVQESFDFSLDVLINGVKNMEEK